jgi:hypothetical protein
MSVVAEKPATSSVLINRPPQPFACERRAYADRHGAVFERAAMVLEPEPPSEYHRRSGAYVIPIRSRSVRG